MIFATTIMISISQANAYFYPKNLNGDPNFILCDGFQGVGWYIDRSSLYVEKYAPPQYIIQVNVVTVDDAINGDNVKISETKNYRFFYNMKFGKMYVDRTGNADWYYLDPHGNRAATGMALPAGEATFALAYKSKFYGLYNELYDGILY